MGRAVKLRTRFVMGRQRGEEVGGGTIIFIITI